MKNRNNSFTMLLFIGTLFFQLTSFKFIWGVEFVSRIMNAILFCLSTGAAIIFYFKKSCNKRVVNYYLIPCFLVYIGQFLNTAFYSFRNPAVINQFGTLIPWSMALCIPYLLERGAIRPNRLWFYFNIFMTVTSLLALVEYFLVFAEFTILRSIETSGGRFLAGYVSMLYSVNYQNQGEEVYYRLYSVFMEPGTLAMFLIPVITYSVLSERYFSVAIYLISMYLTDSLGGIISLIMSFVFIIFIKITKIMSWLPAAGLTIFFAILLVFSSSLSQRYNDKGNSATEREDSFIKFVNIFPRLLINYPLGLPRYESSDEASENSLHSGFNFSIGTSFVFGGILSFTGYILVVYGFMSYSIKNLMHSSDSWLVQVVSVSMISLFPFIFQRATILESGLFSLLFAPFLIQGLNRDC